MPLLPDNDPAAAGKAAVTGQPLLPSQPARNTLPPEEFSVYVQDYLFQTQADRPELSAVLNVPPPVISAPADAPLQDPAVWTAAEADPAIWPPFPKTE